MNEEYLIMINEFIGSLDSLDIRDVYVFGSVLYNHNPKDIDILLIIGKTFCETCSKCNGDINIMKSLNCELYKLFQSTKKYSKPNCYLDVKVTYVNDFMSEWVETFTPFGREDTFVGKGFFDNMKHLSKISDD